MRAPLKRFARRNSSALLFAALSFSQTLSARTITAAGQPGVLDIRAAGTGSLRITLRPENFKRDFPDSPVLPEREYPRPALSLRDITKPVKAEIAGLFVEVQPAPLRVVVTGEDGTLIQSLKLADDGSVTFALDDQPVLGLGEGGPLPAKGADWRQAAVQFDRRGRLDPMLPHWQSDAYGSRNPVALLAGTRGWGIFFAMPWGQIDLTQTNSGRFIPFNITNRARQNFKNQTQQLGKGIPPADSFVPGLLDVFIFDARQPEIFMRDLAAISGPAVLPPKWALGYMQSHRTLETDAQMLGIVDTFRAKRLPLDAVIYLGTGFTPRGWNTPQPSFNFNPEVFKRDPAAVIADLHARNVKVALHIVPWDRDKLPTLQGTIPPRNSETVDASHLENYWQQHVALVNAGVDAWWPDEGDWFDLFERMKRHELYYEGPLSTQPERRPWNLQRNGHLGIARWGGWIWSGDTQATWKTLEAQIAVGLNSSLSLSPYWGSDIGGFLSTKESSGELYARWFQFGAFCPSFRAHGRTWWTRLPWGWGLDNFGPIEDRESPPVSELNNPNIEPIVKRYDELRYQLLAYNYTLAWQARETGMPFMRALWLHYPNDEHARGLGNEFLWGRDLLIAPVFEKGATNRKVYLPAGIWYDWWTSERREGGRTITRPIDLATMPIFVRAGAMVPIDPVRQFTGEKVDAPLALRIYRGTDGDYTLYEDDGETPAYLKGEFTLTHFQWNDTTSTLTIEPGKSVIKMNASISRQFRVEILPRGDVKTVDYNGKAVAISF